jgi:signal transduction histidine kinase
MENFTSYINRTIGKTIIFTTLMFWIALVGILSVSTYITTSKNLESNLENSLNQITSFLYDNNWSSIDSHFKSNFKLDNYSSVEMKLKSSGEVIYAADYESEIIPRICKISSRSDLVHLHVCASIVSEQFLAVVFISFIFFVIVFLLFLFNVRKSAISVFHKMSENLSRALHKPVDDDQVLQIVEFIDLKNVLRSNQEQIALLSHDSAYVSVSRRVAHDIRSPLSVLENIIQKGALTAEDFYIIDSSAKRIKEISDYLLENTAKASFPSRLRIDLNKELYYFFESKKVEFNFKNVQFSSNGSFFDIYLWVNKTLFFRIISNLVNNSIEAVEGDLVSIHFELQWHEKGLLLEIVDNGKGFTSSQLLSDCLPSSSKENGYGIGMTSASDELRKMGCTLTFGNNESVGAYVRILIPKVLLIERSAPIVLVDDDRYIRISWQNIAAKRNYCFFAFSNFEELLLNSQNLPKGSEFFIDSNLGDQVGELLIQKLFDLGFWRLNIETGKSIDSFTDIKNLNSVVTKVFPYS